MDSLSSSKKKKAHPDLLKSVLRSIKALKCLPVPMKMLDVLIVNTFRKMIMRCCSLEVACTTRRKWIGAALIVLPIIMLLFSACRKHSEMTACKGRSDQEDIQIGVFLALTGADASYGKFALQGLQLAVREINTHGGILGRKMKLIIEDDQSKPGEASVIVRNLANRYRVSALLGEIDSGRTLEAAPIAQNNKIPLITLASTNLRVTQVGDYIFRVCFTDSLQGKIMAKFARSLLGVRRVAIMLDNSKSYSVGLTKNFSKDFIARGGQIVARQIYQSGEKDFTAQLTAVKAAHPEAVFLPSFYTDAAAIIRQARQQNGLEVTFLGGDGWDCEQFLKLGGKAVEGVYFCTHFSFKESISKGKWKLKNFVRNYEKEYSIFPSTLAALSYDAVRLLADAIRRAGSTEPARTRAALAATKNFSGVTGNITFDENRNPKKPAVIIRVQDGNFTYLNALTP